MEASRSWLAATLAPCAASCGLFFEDPPLQPSTSSGSTSSGELVAPGPGCHQLDSGPFTSFEPAGVADMTIHGDRVYFVGCATRGDGDELPGAPTALEGYVASVRLDDLCEPEVQYLGPCDADGAGPLLGGLRLSRGGEGVLVSFTLLLEDGETRLCMADVLDDLTGAAPGACPPTAIVDCTAAALVPDPNPSRSSFLAPSAVRLGDSFTAAAVVAGSSVGCDVPSAGPVPIPHEFGTIAIDGVSPTGLAALGELVFAGVAPEPSGTAVLGMCYAGGLLPNGTACQTSVLVEGQTTPDLPWSLDSVAAIAGFEPVLPIHAALPAFFAHLSSTSDAKIGYLWSLDGSLPSAPQLQAERVGASLDLEEPIVYSAAANGAGGLVIGGTAPLPFHDLDCEAPCARYGFVGEITGQQTGDLRLSAIRPAGTTEVGCSEVGIVAAEIVPGTDDVLVAGVYTCAEVDLAQGRGVVAAPFANALFLARLPRP